MTRYYPTIGMDIKEAAAHCIHKSVMAGERVMMTFNGVELLIGDADSPVGVSTSYRSMLNGQPSIAGSPSLADIANALLQLIDDRVKEAARSNIRPPGASETQR